MSVVRIKIAPGDFSYPNLALNIRKYEKINLNFISGCWSFLFKLMLQTFRISKGLL